MDEGAPEDDKQPLHLSQMRTIADNADPGGLNMEVSL